MWVFPGFDLYVDIFLSLWNYINSIIYYIVSIKKTNVYTSFLPISYGCQMKKEINDKLGNINYTISLRNQDIT